MSKAKIHFGVFCRFIKLVCLCGCIESSLFAKDRETDQTREFLIYENLLTNPRRHPEITLFPKGKDKKGARVQSAIDRLQFWRPVSKLYPPEKNSKGLGVVFQGMRFIPQREQSNYLVDLLGEFNAYRVVVTANEMKDIVSGKERALHFKSLDDYPIYTATIDVEIGLKIEGETLCIRSILANFAFTEFGSRYESAEVKPKKNDETDACLYRGVSGRLPQINVMNDPAK